MLLAHLIGDGSFVRRQPIRYASIDEANLERSQRRRRSTVRCHCDPRRLPGGQGARRCGCLPRSNSTTASGTRSPHGSTRSDLFGLRSPREVRARRGLLVAEAADWTRSFGTSGRRTAVFTGSEDRLRDGSTTPRPVAGSRRRAGCCSASRAHADRRCGRLATATATHAPHLWRGEPAPVPRRHRRSWRSGRPRDEVASRLRASRATQTRHGPASTFGTGAGAHGEQRVSTASSERPWAPIGSALAWQSPSRALG